MSDLGPSQKRKIARAELVLEAWRILVEALEDTSDTPTYYELFAAESRLYNWLARRPTWVIRELRARHGEPVPDWVVQEC